MKKLIFGITAAMLILLIAILTISFQKNITTKDCYLTIPRIMTYHYQKDKEMNFEIFVNNEHSLIEFTEKNSYYLEENNNSYPLSDVRIKKELDYENKEEIFYKYTITSSLFSFSENDIILKECKIRIENDSFTFIGSLGYLAIYKESYLPLEFYDLYGNYAYMNNELHLIGITVQLSSTYKNLNRAHIGPAYVKNEFVLKDSLLESEVPNSKLEHRIVEEEKPQHKISLTARQNYYFLPISYPKLFLITSGCILFEIDDQIFYLEDFTYLANPISIKDYPTIRLEGTVQYA